MDRGGAGISWKHTISGNDYKQPDDHVGASGSGRYRHGTVRQANEIWGQVFLLKNQCRLS
ncbi:MULTISPECIES: hypothetical protein [unclassified Endozoicomonas]|uniref:hypothetical protein n=1 Tax=unclassified Endozoicomonas TaxID=2644528 RepID=UPI003BB66C3F